MELEEFWAVVESADGDEGALKAALDGRPKGELQAFDRRYREQLNRAYRWDVWGAGYVAQGGMSDDSFDYFCDWLIGRGRSVFERVLADPDALADVDRADEGEAEGLRYAVQEAYEDTHGEELPFPEDLRQPEDPAGDEWDEDEVAELYPRTAAKFG